MKINFSRNNVLNRIAWPITPLLIIGLALIAGLYFGINAVDGEKFLTGISFFLSVLFLGALFTFGIYILVGASWATNTVLDAVVAQIPKHKKVFGGFLVIVTIAFISLSVIWGLSIYNVSPQMAVDFIKVSMLPWTLAFVLTFFSMALFVLSRVTELGNEKSEIETKVHETEMSLADAVNRAETAEAKVTQLENQLGEQKDAPQYISQDRITELREISFSQFDLSKLIKLCEELNDNYANGNVFAVAMLTRGLIDHIPPIFGFKLFKELANNYGDGGRSFKKSMQNLNNSLKNIADAGIHSTIRSKEILPNRIRVDFSSDVDVLLGEIVRKLKPRE